MDQRKTELMQPWEQLAAALHKFGAEYGYGPGDCHWNCSLDPNRALIATAYIGRRHIAVAHASHRELLVAQRLLAWELEELCRALRQETMS